MPFERARHKGKLVVADGTGWRIFRRMTDQPYRIASYCSSPSWGGLEMNVLRFLRWMKQRGWPVALYGRPDARMYREAEQNDILTGPIVSKMRAGDLLNSWRLARRIRANNVGLLIVHRSLDLFLGVMARKLAGKSCTLIYHQHMHIGVDKKDPYHAWLYRQFDAAVTPVKWLADRMLEKTTVPPNRLHIIPRGIEVARYTIDALSREKARARFGLPPGETVIGLIGRLDPKKGQDIALRALERLHRDGHRVHLLLVGDTSFDEGDSYARDIKRLTEELKLTDFVHFSPHIGDVETAYAALDIFVLASKSEAYGMVTIEALTSGLPVIGTNDGGTVSLIDHERTGLLVEPMNVEDLAAALRRLLTDREFATRLGATARDEAVVRFSHETQCRAWETLLAELKTKSKVG